MTKEQETLFDGLGPVLPSPLRRHPLYAVWQTMRRRCADPRHEKFPNYGGRGIVVCEEWRASSRAFIAWALVNGWQPGLQLDRRDNDGPYSPGNCRFVTRSVNRLNLRCTIRLADGQPAVPVARLYGISPDMLRVRVKRLGWSVSDAVSIPKGGKRPAATAAVALGESEASAQGDPAQRSAALRKPKAKRKRRAPVIRSSG